ncbi:MAG: hypothetical protein PHX30_00345 [Candidatus Pacebacteria bacterium]|nr:hypothetical protein [Candidatus Paceibacterota bacterium]
MQEGKQNKLALLQQMIDNADRNIVAAKQIMKELNSDNHRAPRESEASQIVEGTFDGEKMVSMEGKVYPVPANYASKSKLVEGDILKLTITEDGSFVYKKISSVDTRKIIGTVMKDGKDKYYVNAEGRKYNVLLASLTYFKAREGDEVILVLPKEKVSSWGAVESIISDDDRREMLAQEEEFEDEQIPGQGSIFEQGEEPITDEAPAENPVAFEEERRNASIEEEWTPDVEAIKKEGTMGQAPAAEGDISDDFSN